MKKVLIIIGLFLLFVEMSFSQSKKKVLPKSPFRLVMVSNSDELKNALKFAKPGDSIVLKDGVYSGKFIIPETANGTKKAPIILTGNKQAVLDAGSIASGYVLYLKVNFWKIKGITIKNGLKGIVADAASENIFDELLVTQIGEEAIHLRKFSKNNTIRNCEITYTGLKTPDYGEGIYIGSAYSNWVNYTNNEPDKCDSNKIINNKIGPHVMAECIDVKEGTTGGIVEGNTFEAEGISGANSADSWMDVKGNGYQIINNRGYNTHPSVLKDGYQVNCTFEGWGNNNVFSRNICEINASGFGINVRLKSSKGEVQGTIIYDDNSVINAESGVANIGLTPKIKKQ